MRLGALFALFNLSMVGLIVASQYSELRKGAISERRPWSASPPFPYFQDFYTSLWGDTIGVSLLDFSAAMALSLGYMPNSIALALGVAAIAIPALFHVRFLSAGHGPDSLYPRTGVSSLTGKLHIAYFGIQTFVLATFIAVALQGHLPSNVVVIGWIGGVIYTVTLLLDIGLGHFDLRLPHGPTG